MLKGEPLAKTIKAAIIESDPQFYKNRFTDIANKLESGKELLTITNEELTSSLEKLDMSPDEMPFLLLTYKSTRLNQ